MRKKKSIIAIVGPTASGKSELAVKLAKKCNGEIISADSRQVYQGLSIGSGRVEGRWGKKFKNKINKKVMVCNIFQPSQKSDTNNNNDNDVYVYKTIPHHCIDYVSPKKCYTVVDFQQCAWRAINDIRARGKIPFLVGGTGFYIDAVIGNIPFPSVPPNSLLRKKLERFPAEKLFSMLKKCDPRRAATIDSYNKRRLVRALEIIEKTKKIIPPHAHAKSDDTQRSLSNVALLIGVKKDKKILQKSIAKRVRTMLKRGLVAETKKLRAQGLSWKRIAEFGFEYRLPALFLQKKISRKELENQLIKENWRYAKRQMTWWRRNKNIRLVPSLIKAQTFLTKALK